MSEQVIKALMQLFAIIAHPESNSEERRLVVEQFLNKQLNQETTNIYLKVFDNYYNKHQKKQRVKSKRKKRTSSSSVRVLKICTQINEELTQKQKNVVLIQLLEFINSGESITDQELEFVTSVAETFHISRNEFNEIKEFVIHSKELLPNSNKLLIISNSDFSHDNIHYIKSNSLEGQLRVLNISSSNMYFIKYIGSSEIYLNGQLLNPGKIHGLSNGASIKNPKIKPIYYGDIISQFNIDKIKSKITFDVNNIEYKFKSGDIGLHKMNFREESGKLVGIMGASGAGKSTLLN
ncbi:MAG: ABC transporter, partial [Bacteroidota bacterium]|nr:ABC transporter [Bacteroidota bacterium]